MGRNSNGINHPGRHGAVPVALELAALDDLGPKARFAVVNAPLPTLAYPIVAQVIERNEKLAKIDEERIAAGLSPVKYLDLRDPVIDAAIARSIMESGLNHLRTERSIEDALAGLKPLRGKPSAKSAREQLRTDRRSRRAMR